MSDPNDPNDNEFTYFVSAIILVLIFDVFLFLATLSGCSGSSPQLAQASPQSAVDAMPATCLIDDPPRRSRRYLTMRHPCDWETNQAKCNPLGSQDELELRRYIAQMEVFLGMVIRHCPVEFKIAPYKSFPYGRD